MRTVYKCLKQKYRVIKFDVWGLQVIKGKIHLQNLVLRCIHKQFIVWEKTLEGTARYAGLNLASAEGFGQGHFLCVQKKSICMHLLDLFGIFLCSVEILVPLKEEKKFFLLETSHTKI